MLISIQVVVEVDVVLGNRCSLVAWFTTFSVCRVVVGGGVGGWLGGWVLKLRIRLSQLSTKM